MIFFVAIFTTVASDILDLQDKIHNTSCGSEVFSDKTECYFVSREDEITVLDGVNTTIPDNSIFFVETSCSGGLNYLQACSVESAARAHPDRQINVLFPGPVARICLKVSPLWDIMKYKNIRVYRIFLIDFLKDTPLEEFLTSGNFLQSHFPVHHASDLLRFTVLYKFGGIYLDLDVVVAKAFDTLHVPKNWVGLQRFGMLATALIALAKDGIGKRIAEETMRRFLSDFQPYSLEYNNIGIFKKVLQVICGVEDIRRMTAEACQGFEVYAPEYFYPIPFSNHKAYFDFHDRRIPSTPYAFHLWNYVTQGLPIYDDTLIAYLIDTFCPKVSLLMH